MLSNALSAVWPNLNQPEEPRTTNFNYNGLAAQTAGSKFVTLAVVPEPSAVLLGLGALSALRSRRRRSGTSPWWAA